MSNASKMAGEGRIGNMGGARGYAGMYAARTNNQLKEGSYDDSSQAHKKISAPSSQSHTPLRQAPPVTHLRAAASFYEPQRQKYHGNIDSHRMYMTSLQRQHPYSGHENNFINRTPSPTDNNVSQQAEMHYHRLNHQHHHPHHPYEQAFSQFQPELLQGAQRSRGRTMSSPSHMHDESRILHHHNGNSRFVATKKTMGAPSTSDIRRRSRTSKPVSGTATTPHGRAINSRWVQKQLQSPARQRPHRSHSYS